MIIYLIIQEYYKNWYNKDKVLFIFITKQRKQRKQQKQQKQH